ncbi:MAG: translesion DNA synthesis-associated protein ImuA [Sulfuricaulis sp.]
MSLEDLLQRADLWRGGTAPPVAGLPSGFAPLDAQLPGAGWPTGALVEILIERHGIGELQLLMPALARLTSADRWVAFIAPPYIPYAPALARAGMNLAHVLVVHPRESNGVLWAAEQALRAGTCGAVLAWPVTADMKRLRRLQLAAETGQALGVLFRPASAAAEHSPAALRLKLEPAAGSLAVHILKRRGGWPTGPVIMERQHALAGRTSARSPARDFPAWRSRR